MFKWIVALAAVILLFLFIRWQRGTMKSSYVNGLPEYADLPNREFILERDCYLFKFKDRDTDWPLLGDHAAVPELPARVSEAEVGADLPGVRILDVARIGSQFRLVSVRRDETRHGATITFELLFLDEAQRKYPRVDANWVMDHAPEARGRAPSLREDYFAPLVFH